MSTISNSAISNNIFYYNYNITASNGGPNFGIYMKSYMTNITFNNNSVQFSIGRPALYINTNNWNVTISNCYFANNINENNGAAISINTNNTMIKVINSTFNNNSAGTGSGGAIYSSQSNTYLTIASCTFFRNSAATGGAIFLGQSHSNFAIMDYKQYQNYLQIQTAHPYVSKKPVNGKPSVAFSQFVQLNDAIQFIISFDARTSIWNYDSLYIYNSPNKTSLLYMNIGGQATFPGVNLPNLFIYGNQFYVEILGPTVNYALPLTFWGILMNVYPVFSSSTSTSLFTENSASSSGGAFYSKFLTTFPLILSTDFISNTATGDGAGIIFYLACYGMTFSRLRFINNTAQRGAAFAFSSSNYGVQVMESYFFNNTAVTGGAIFLGAYNGQGLLAGSNEIFFNASNLINNSASEGGGLTTYFENIVSLNDISFIGNRATYFGGSVNLENSNFALFSSTTFTNNTVDGDASSIGSKSSNTINLTNTVISSNSASGCGTLFLKDQTVLSLYGTNIISNNTAGVAGGAIYLDSAPLFSNFGYLIVSSNEAMLGSAIALGLVTESENVINNVSISDNVATVGGTFFWLCTGICKEPLNTNVSFRNNSAPYGKTFATQLTNIYQVSEEYQVSVYDRPLSPSIVLTFFDFYSQEIVSDNITVTEAYVESYECDGLVGSLTSSTSENPVNGVVTYNDISAFCNPNGQLTIEYIARPSLSYFDISDPSYYYVVNTSVWTFRSCNNGEKYTNGACISCVNGSYSLMYEIDVGCQPCPDESFGCYGNQINLKPGYWRISTQSNTILKCPYLGCMGGYGVDQQLCQIGYESVLCAVCSIGYYYNQDRNECLPCEGADVISPALILIFALLFIVLLALCIYAYVKFIKNSIQIDDNIDESALKNSKVKDVMEKMNRFSERMGPLMAKAKIIISTFQILTTSLASFSIEMPTSYTKFMASLNFISLDFVNVMPLGKASNTTIITLLLVLLLLLLLLLLLGCIKRLSFIESLLIKTLFPPCFIGLLFVIFMIEFSIRRNNLMKKRPDEVQLKASLMLLISGLKFRYISLALLFSYISLPGLTVSIFQTFICQNIDPSNIIYPNGAFYLVADYSISCSSSQMTFARVYAAVMIILYPVGIPCLYLRLLFRKRHELKVRNDNIVKRRRKDVKKNKIKAFVDEYAINRTDDSSLKRSTQMYKFLYDSYKPNYWFFEVVETTRRLMLTAVLSVIASGSSSQVVCGILLSVGYMKIYAYYQPYSLEESSILAELAQYQIFFSFFGSLIIQNSLLPVAFNKVVGVMMILLNLSTSLLAAYFEYRSSSSAAETESNKLASDDNNISTNSSSDSAITINPLQHRIVLSGGNSSSTDIEVANFSTSSTSSNNVVDDVGDVVDDDTVERQSYVKQVVSKFESQLVLRPKNNNDYDSDDEV